VGALAVPSLAVFVPRGVAPLLALLAVALLLVDGRRCVRAAYGMFGLLSMLTMLSLWCIASAAWSIIPEHSLVMALRFVLISAAGLLVLGAANSLEAHQRARIRKAVILGLLIAVALLLIERVAGTAALTRFDRAAVVVVLLLWPALRSQRRVWPALGTALAVVVAVMTMVSTAAKIALLVSVPAACVARYAPRLVAATFGGGLVLLAVVLPLAVPDFHSVVAIHEKAPWIKSSGIHRMMIWRFTADRIADRPILGWGMDASRALPGGHTDLDKALPSAGFGPGVEALPLHPHNAVLQWRVELGVPGTALSLTIVVWALWRLARQESLSLDDRAGALAWAAAALVVAMLSYGIWQEWWLSSLWLTSAFYAAVVDGGPSRVAHKRTPNEAAHLGT
jgi:O-antigen ligase